MSGKDCYITFIMESIFLFISNSLTFLICFWGYIFVQDQKNWFDGHHHTPVLPVYKVLYPKCSWTVCRRDRVVFSSPITIRRNWTYCTGSGNREFQCQDSLLRILDIFPKPMITLLSQYFDKLLISFIQLTVLNRVFGLSGPWPPTLISGPRPLASQKF